MGCHYGPGHPTDNQLSGISKCKVEEIVSMTGVVQRADECQHDTIPAREVTAGWKMYLNIVCVGESIGRCSNDRKKSSFQRERMGPFHIIELCREMADEATI